jgi:hypothetical protein
MTGSLIWECDSCADKRVGFSRTELLTEGWQWHDAGRNDWIVVCGVCEARHAARRKAAA